MFSNKACECHFFIDPLPSSCGGVNELSFIRPGYQVGRAIFKNSLGLTITQLNQLISRLLSQATSEFEPVLGWTSPSYPAWWWKLESSFLVFKQRVEPEIMGPGDCHTCKNMMRLSTGKNADGCVLCCTQGRSFGLQLSTCFCFRMCLRFHSCCPVCLCCVLCATAFFMFLQMFVWCFCFFDISSEDSVCVLSLRFTYHGFFPYFLLIDWMANRLDFVIYVLRFIRLLVCGPC